LYNVQLPVFEPISDQEIEWACGVMRLPLVAFAGDDGNDPRLAVMRSLESLDIEACPGSGKTTLLVAKLAILANRWNSRRQGICVLSHTNAARTEIGDRLSSTSAGHLLLRHPHFVGTIHSFVNEFLAIPWLRSKGWPIKVIDTQIALNNRWWRLPRGTRSYLERQHVGPAALGYTQANFAGGGKSDYSPGTETHQNMLRACREATASGYYCFDEMFVWATELLDRCPDAIETIRSRFPLVFIDEVQDNSELQSAFLYHLFADGKGPVARQRFGDSNQAIYHRAGASGAVTDTFPGDSKADLPNSFRFHQAVADLAAPLGVRPQSLVGRGPPTSRIWHEGLQSVLFLFSNDSVRGVLPAYAQHLIDSFASDALAQGDFTAICGVHRAEKDDHLPRFIGHYAPEYDPDVSGRQPKPNNLWQFLGRARLELAGSRNTHPIANCCAESILQLVRLAGVELPLSLRKSPNRYLLDRFKDDETRKRYFNLLDCLISSRCEPSHEAWTGQIAPAVRLIAEAIAEYEISDQCASGFLAWYEADAQVEATEPQRRSTNLFQYPRDDPKVSIRLGSIHGAKGETHTATLVLESYHQAHHLKKLIPWLIGKRPKTGTDNTGEDGALKERLKLHYVGMTRPSHLLCLAMRKDAFKATELELMRKRNWLLIECAAPEQVTTEASAIVIP
jgi:DNA helicase II / ATP-dependent DNA helicase PcrA